MAVVLPPVPAVFYEPSVFALGVSDSCDIERTSLSVKQIRHALPQYLFDELFQESSLSEYTNNNSSYQPQQQTATYIDTSYVSDMIAINEKDAINNRKLRARRGSRGRSNSNSSGTQSPMVSTPPTSPKTAKKKDESGSNRYLIKCICALPKDLQMCFTEWRRERKEAIMCGDMAKQKSVERVMWNALNSINARQA